MPINFANSVSNHPLNAGLVGWWLPLRNNSGGRTLFDLCGKTHGTLTNGPTWTAGRSPEFGLLTLDGTDDYVTFGTPASLASLSAVTVSAVVRFPNFSGFQMCWTRASSTYPGGRDWEFRGNQTNAVPYGSFRVGGTLREVTGPTAITANVWHHVAMMYDGAAVTVWVDGRQQASTAATGSVASSRELRFGSFSDNADFGEVAFEGFRIDAAAVSPAFLHDQSLRGYPDLLRRLPTSRSFVGQAAGGSSIIPIVQHLNRMRRAG